MLPDLTGYMLKNWPLGQTQFELFCAGVLRTEGHTSVRPQAPRGGSDGRKDILSYYNGLLCQTACHFSIAGDENRSPQSKFTYDFAGMKRYNAQCFIFMTNRRISVPKRDALIASVLPCEAIIFEYEFLVTLLNSPKGFSLREQYFHIAISESERVSWEFARHAGVDTLPKIAVRNPHSFLKNDKMAPAQTLSRLTGFVHGLEESNEEPYDKVCQTSGNMSLQRISHFCSAVPCSGKGDIRLIMAKSIVL